MATLNPQQAIAPTQLTATSVSLYTVPSSTVTVTRRFTFANTDTTAYNFTVHIAPSGVGAVTSTLFINEERLGPKKTVSPPELEGLVLEAGDEIWIKADTTLKINVIGSVTEIA